MRRESAASGRLGLSSTRLAKCCLAPGVLRRLLGLRGPARNKVQDCRRGSVSPAPSPLCRCGVTSQQEMGATSHPYRSPRAAVTNDPNLDGFDRQSVFSHISGGLKSKVKVSAGQETIPCLSPGFPWPPPVLGSPVSAP